MPSPAVILLQQAIDTALQMDPGSQGVLAELDQKVIQVHVRGLDLDLFIFVVDGKVEVSGMFDGDVDTVVSGTPLSLAGLSRDMQGVLSGDVDISGDLSVGRKAKRLITELDIDWEDQLSNIIGGAATHQLSRFRREFNHLFFRTASNFRQNTSEYLTEETNMLINPSELKQFLDEVDLVRAHADRLEARLDLLGNQAIGESD